MANLAIIPARAGSKRIKNKNIKNFFGKPIIHYSIENSLDSKIFNKIHISTDSKKIKKIVEDKNMKIDFLRPKNLATDTTPTYKVVDFTLNEYKKKGVLFDTICLLTACCPLISKKDIINAYDLFKKNNSKIPVMSVAEFDVPIEWAFKKDSKDFILPINLDATLRNSQDFKKKYYDTGSFVIYPTSIFYKRKFKKINKYVGYVLPKHKAVDIDNTEDWKIAEIFYKYKHENNLRI